MLPESRVVGGSLVSVVIPSYNHSRYVARAIESVLTQAYRPLELIVVDDGSTDASKEVIHAVIEDHEIDNIVFVTQENQGAHNAINRGVELSSGVYLSVLNSDDYYHPGRMEQMIRFAEAVDAGVVFSGVRFVDNDGKDLPPDNPWPKWYRRCLEETENLPTVGYHLLVHNLSVTSGNFLFNRELYEVLGGFCDYRFAHDWDFLIRSVYYAEPLFVPEPLMSYRVHGGNTTESVRGLMEEECTASFERYLRLFDRPSPNTLAPSPANWPRYFDEFTRAHSPFFRPSIALADLLETNFAGGKRVGIRDA